MLTPFIKSILVFSTIIFLCLLFIVLSYLGPTLWSPEGTITVDRQDELRALADSTLAAEDVPVAALLVYGDSVIGRGYNTLRKERTAGGHAEINAISNAFHRVGVENFRKLNRDSLLLLSTFEPCAMCRGAILEYRITRVEYLKAKPLSHLLREDVRYLLYLWRREQREPSSLQESLFLKHPYYRP